MTNSASIHRCPVCKTSNNTKGQPLFDDRSIALHIAGKARGGCSLHRSWALNKVSNNLNFKESINEISEKIVWAVVEARERSQLSVTSSPYDFIVAIERRLHRGVREILMGKFGEVEIVWWVTGVPQPIRVKCAERCEKDNCREPKYSYTDILDLLTIIDKNWRLFEYKIKSTSSVWRSKKAFLGDLNELNNIRRLVMHPVRQKQLTKDNIIFLTQFNKNSMQLFPD